MTTKEKYDRMEEILTAVVKLELTAEEGLESLIEEVDLYGALSQITHSLMEDEGVLPPREGEYHA